jgi:hypothetical protein
MSVAEQLAKACGTSHLGDSHNHVTDSDILKASGAVAQHEPLGVALIRMLYAQDFGQSTYVLTELAAIARRRGIEDALLLTAEVLQNMVHPACHECRGRGAHLVASGRPVLSDEPCGACEGTGQKLTTDPDELWLVETVRQHVRAAAHAIGEKLF